MKFINEVSRTSTKQIEVILFILNEGVDFMKVNPEFI